jgi:hypothetical protein
MDQLTQEGFAIPDTAVRGTRKEKAELVEALDHSVGAVRLLEQREDRPDGAFSTSAIFALKLHSPLPLSLATPAIWRPSCLSSAGDTG